MKIYKSQLRQLIKEVLHESKSVDVELEKEYKAEEFAR